MKTLRVAEVAAVLGISAGTVYRLLETGKLPGVKIGGSWRVSADGLKGALDAGWDKRRAEAATSAQEDGSDA